MRGRGYGKGRGSAGEGAVRGAQVEDGLGRGQVLNVAVLGLKLWMEISKNICCKGSKNIYWPVENICVAAYRVRGEV